MASLLLFSFTLFRAGPRPRYFPGEGNRFTLSPTLDGIVGSLDFISSLSVLVVVVLSRIYERKWFSFGWSLKRERAERSVPRGQRDISMDGRVNEGLCVSSGVGSRAFEGEVEVNRCRLKRS